MSKSPRNYREIVLKIGIIALLACFSYGLGLSRASKAIYLNPDTVQFGRLAFQAGHVSGICSMTTADNCKKVPKNYQEFLEWINEVIRQPEIKGGSNGKNSV